MTQLSLCIATSASARLGGRTTEAGNTRTKLKLQCSRSVFALPSGAASGEERLFGGDRTRSGLDTVQTRIEWLRASLGARFARTEQRLPNPRSCRTNFCCSRFGVMQPGNASRCSQSCTPLHSGELIAETFDFIYLRSAYFAISQRTNYLKLLEKCCVHFYNQAFALYQKRVISVLYVQTIAVKNFLVSHNSGISSKKFNIPKDTMERLTM